MYFKFLYRHICISKYTDAQVDIYIYIYMHTYGSRDLSTDHCRREPLRLRGQVFPLPPRKRSSKYSDSLRQKL